MAAIQIDPNTGERIQPQGSVQIDPETGERITTAPTAGFGSGPVAGAGPLGTPDFGQVKPNVQMPNFAKTVQDAPVQTMIGMAKSIPGTMAGIARLAGSSDASDPLDAVADTHGSQAQSIGKGAGNVGQFLIPGPGEEKAGLLAMEQLPKIARFAGPAARIGTGAIDAGIINKAQGGKFSTGATTGLFGGMVGEGVRAMAPAFAESALNVTGNDKMYGRTVGRAILDDTRGIKPATVEASARDTISQLTPQVEQAAADAGASGARGSLAPARQSVASKINTHTTNRAVKSAQELQPLQDFLDKDAVSGLPLAQNQTPTGILQLKRGLDSDFIGNWNPTRNTNNELDTAKQAYGKLADEFHAAAPGTKELDQRVSSLFPVVDRANRASRAPSIVESTMHRFRTPTGALIGAVGGGTEGYREGGLTGALLLAGAGAIMPSVVANPATQMLFARTANKAVPLLFAPAATGAANQLLRKK